MVHEDRDKCLAFFGFTPILVWGTSATSYAQECIPTGCEASFPCYLKCTCVSDQQQSVIWETDACFLGSWPWCFSHRPLFHQSNTSSPEGDHERAWPGFMISIMLTVEHKDTSAIHCSSASLLLSPLHPISTSHPTIHPCSNFILLL